MKIKTFINEKPRLKKVLKIIATSVVIFFATFGVVCSGLLVGSCANQKANQIVATERANKQAISYESKGCYLYSSIVVYSTNVVKRLYSLNTEFFTHPAIDQVFVFNMYESPYNEVGEWDYLQLTDNIYIYNNPFHFNALKYVCRNILAFGVDSTGLIKHYQVYALNTTNSQEMLLGSFDYITENPGNNAQRSFGFVDNPSQVNGNLIIRVDKYTNPNMYDLLSLDDDNQGFFDYQSGYNTGYIQGESEGYTNGFNEGYEQGRTGISSNPFNLIKSAFESLSGIFNISIIPGLTLGVLIFAPLVILILIAIIRLIKG